MILELFFVAGALIYLYFSFQPALISPSSGFIIDEFDFHFEIEHADTIFVSTTPDFEHPLILSKDKEMVLAPGIYYWKAVSLLGESDVRNFTITTSLVLALSDTGSTFRVFNQGNIDANVTQDEERSFVIQPKASSEFEKNDSQDSQFEGRPL